MWADRFVRAVLIFFWLTVSTMCGVISRPLSTVFTFALVGLLSPILFGILFSDDFVALAKKHFENGFRDGFREAEVDAVELPWVYRKLMAALDLPPYPVE